MIEFDASEKWEGLDSLGAEALEDLRRNAEVAVNRAALRYREGVQETLTGKRSGRTYVVSKTGRPHIASRAGSQDGTGAEPPANLTGTLRRSIAVSPAVWEGWEIAARIGTNVAYARRLEYGGVHTTTKAVSVQVEPGVWRRIPAGTVIRTLPRPFFEPTALRLGPELEAMLEDAVNGEGR